MNYSRFGAICAIPNQRKRSESASVRPYRNRGVPCGVTVCFQRKSLCVHFDIMKSALNVILYMKDLQMCAYCPDSGHVAYFIIHCQ